MPALLEDVLDVLPGRAKRQVPNVQQAPLVGRVGAFALSLALALLPVLALALVLVLVLALPLGTAPVLADEDRARAEVGVVEGIDGVLGGLFGRVLDDPGALRAAIN